MKLWPFGYTVFKSSLLQMCLQVGNGTANVITLKFKQQLTYGPYPRNKQIVMPLYSRNFEIIVERKKVINCSSNLSNSTSLHQLFIKQTTLNPFLHTVAS